MKHCVVVLAAILSGCAFTPQQASIKPTVTVAESSVGAGTVVAVRVVDERASKSLGRRGTAYGAAAEITAKEDVAAIVHKEITDGLRRKGFATTDYADSANPRLSVELRLLEYSTSQGFWTGGVNIKGTLKAAAAREGRSYEQMYRVDREERIVVVPTAATNEQWINTALSEVITQLLDDQGLTNFLARGL